jgi:hypothetical protein
MTNDSATNWIDPDRTMCLCDAGNPDYLAATAVAADGTEHLLLAQCDGIGDESVRYDFTCADVAHEQLGVLSPRWAARVALAPLRCGRRTKAGTACRTQVARAGGACAWHRQPTREKNKR